MDQRLGMYMAADCGCLAAGAFKVYLRIQCSDDHEMLEKYISPMAIDMSAISGYNSKSILYLFIIFMQASIIEIKCS